MGFVYLLLSTDSDGEKELFKIGITKTSIEKRIKSLSTGNPNKISLLKSYSSKNYKEIEKWLHSKYFSNKTESKNEWFYLTDEQVIKFNDTCKEIDETINFIKSNNTYMNK
jgi:RNA processing factor Prp31